MGEGSRQQWFDILESLFEHPGWDVFIRDFIADEAEELPKRAFENATTMDQIEAARMVRDKLTEIKNLPDLIARARQQELDHATEEAEGLRDYA